MSRLQISLFFIAILALLAVQQCRADLWGDLGQAWESTKDAVAQGGSDAHEWVKEKAVPVIKTGYNGAKSYIHEATAPEGTDEEAD